MACLLYTRLRVVSRHFQVGDNSLKYTSHSLKPSLLINSTRQTYRQTYQQTYQQRHSFSTTPIEPVLGRVSTTRCIVTGAFLLGAGYIYYRYYYSQPYEIQLEDTVDLYASKSTSELAFSLFILKLCSIRSVVEYGPKLLELALKLPITAPTYWIVKQTFFRNFVAGETTEECSKVVEKLQKDGVGVVLDYSIETGGGSKEELDAVADKILDTILIAAKHPTSSFACLKMSGLTSSALLERFTTILQYKRANPKADLSHLLGITVPNYISSRHLPATNIISTPPPPLTPQEQEELQHLIRRLNTICDATAKVNVPVLIDAEQTYYQPAIDCLALMLCSRYNKQRPIVYNTYQMYLKDTSSRLTEDINQAKKGGYRLGVKLVRGAYMQGEKERADALGYEDPINPSLEDTHISYQNGINITLRNLDTVGVLLGSHNEHSVLNTMDRLHDGKVDGKEVKNAVVQFGQLYGMGDHLTLRLANNGQKVFKYVPFGPIEHVMPYLIRRMHENTGFIGSTSAKERALLWKELHRRIFL